MILKIEEIDDNLLFSQMIESNDTRPADIYTFEPKKYPELVYELNQYSATLAKNDNHRLLKNYINIDFFIYPVVTMYKRNNSITGFATGWDRDFYLDKSIRILNRFYHDKNTSRVKFTREILRPSTFQCIQHQILIASRLNYEYAFISREPRTNKFFKKFINSLSHRGTHKWEFREGPYLVAPNPSDPSCWQSIGATKLNKSEKDFWSSWNGKIN